LHVTARSFRTTSFILNPLFRVFFMFGMLQHSTVKSTKPRAISMRRDDSCSLMYSPDNRNKPMCLLQLQLTTPEEHNRSRNKAYPIFISTQLVIRNLVDCSIARKRLKRTTIRTVNTQVNMPALPPKTPSNAACLLADDDELTHSLSRMTRSKCSSV